MTTSEPLCPCGCGMIAAEVDAMRAAIDGVPDTVIARLAIETDSLAAVTIKIDGREVGTDLVLMYTPQLYAAVVRYAREMN